MRAFGWPCAQGCLHLSPTSSVSPIPLPSTPAAECLDVEQVAPARRVKALAEGNAPRSLVLYLLLGVYLGVVFLLSEVASWYRIQEMFRFHSPRMYLIIGSAVATGAVSVALIKRFRVSTLHGDPIRLDAKAWSGVGVRYWLGGALFGIGWALLGTCPGPLAALLGTGVGTMAVALLAALAGTWTYGALRHRLPH